MVRRDIDFDFGVENFFFKLGALPLKGTAGIGKETFVPSGDSW